jgi:serine/threonine protein kinase
MLCFLARRGILAPRYYDYYVAGEQACLLMSKIPGRTLDNLRRDDELSPHQAIWIVAHLCLVVHELHRNGYVHHDIKPSNVVVRPDGVPVLIDWGSAEAIRPPADLHQRSTFTPGFVSPDQAHGSARPSNDIFALGMTLDDLIQWPGPRLIEIIRRATTSTKEPYRSAIAMAYDLLQLSILDSLVNWLGLMAI